MFLINCLVYKITIYPGPEVVHSNVLLVCLLYCAYTITLHQKCVCCDETYVRQVRNTLHTVQHHKSAQKVPFLKHI